MKSRLNGHNSQMGKVNGVGAMTLNIFTVHGSEIQDGIMVEVEGSDYGRFRLGDRKETGQRYSRFVTSLRPDVIQTRGGKQWLLQGYMDRGEGRKLLINASRAYSDGSVILRIPSWLLTFPWQPPAEGINFWLGAEGDVRPLIQVGDRTGSKDQLFVLPPHAELFLVDPGKCVALLTVQENGRPSLVEATHEQICGFVYAESLVTPNVPAYHWVLHNLRLLDAEALLDKVIQAHSDWPLPKGWLDEQ